MSIISLAVSGRGLVDPSTPTVHADDQALLRGRAAFETLRVYEGVPFRLEEHLARLTSSAQRIGLPAVDQAGLVRLSELALAHGGKPNAMLRLYWTPGREGLDMPTGIAIVSRIPPDHDERRATGLRLVSLTLGLDAGLRAAAPWLLAGVKSTSYAVNIAAESEARRRGADDAVFLTRDNAVLECPISNIWWRHGDTLETPSLELGILAGVTRAEVIRLAATQGLAVGEGAFPLDRLAGADEAFTSSSVREIMPAVSLDGEPVGDGKPGEAAAQLQRALRAAAEEHARAACS